MVRMGFRLGSGLGLWGWGLEVRGFVRRGWIIHNFNESSRQFKSKRMCLCLFLNNFKLSS